MQDSVVYAHFEVFLLRYLVCRFTPRGEGTILRTLCLFAWPEVKGLCRMARSSGPDRMSSRTSRPQAVMSSFRTISTGQLHALPRFHIQPINVVVYYGSIGRTSFEVSFPLRCFQRLSFPYLATQHCGWRHNWSTSDMFIPVLSY